MRRRGHFSILMLSAISLCGSAVSLQAGSTQAAAPAPAPVHAAVAPTVARPAGTMPQAPRQAGAASNNALGGRIGAPLPNVAPTFSSQFQIGGQTTPAIAGSGVGAPPKQAGRLNFAPAASSNSPANSNSANTAASYSTGYSAPSSNSQVGRIVFTPAPSGPTAITPSMEKFSTVGPTTPMVQAPPPQQPTRITIAPISNSQTAPSAPARITLAPIEPRQNQIAAPSINTAVAGPTTPTIQASQPPTRITVTPANNATSSGGSDLALETVRGLPKATKDVGIGFVQGSASAIKNIVVGTGEAAIGVVKGGGAAVMHPVQTIENVATVVEHPVQTEKTIVNTGIAVGQSAVNSTVQGAEQFGAAINSGNGQAVGRTLGNVYTNVGAALIPGAGEAGTAAKGTTAITDVARAVEVTGGKIATDSKLLSANQGVSALSATRAETVSSNIADKISSGHALDKHVLQEAQFPGITNAQQFSSHIYGIISNPSNVRTLSRGRTAYWDEPSKTVVISDPKSVDGGTAFKPTQGKTYFNNLK